MTLLDFTSLYSRGPAELLAADDVDMQVVHALAALLAVVDDIPADPPSITLLLYCCYRYTLWQPYLPSLMTYLQLLVYEAFSGV